MKTNKEIITEYKSLHESLKKICFDLNNEFLEKCKEHQDRFLFVDFSKQKYDDLEFE